MSGRIYQFGTTTLPGSAARWNVSTPAQKALVKTLGGVYDPERGDRSGLDFPYTLTVSATAYQATQQLLGASLDDYRAMLGKRERLWFKPHDTTQVDRWCWARLVDVNETGSVYNRITQPVDLVFQALSGWNGHAYGGAWNLDSGYYFDNGLYLDSTGSQTIWTDSPGSSVTLTNAGNRTVTNLGIHMTCAMGITNITFSVYNVAQFSYTGTISPADVFIIDCGARSVTLNGVGAYAGFTLGPNHYTADWLPLTPGDTSLTISSTGGENAQEYFTFVYSDGWV